MSETPYFPESGDVVLFPGAHFEFNQTLRCVITGTAGDLVSFKAEDRGMTYTYPIGRLREIGITKIPAERADTEGRPMTETTARIRWTGDDDEAIGCVGTLNPAAFRIWEASEGGEWLLTSILPGHQGARTYGDNPETLKAEAERWLAGFVSSLGAVFPDGPTRPSRAWHADWAEVDRDQSGNAILRHKPTGGMYKILPVEEC